MSCVCLSVRLSVMCLDLTPDRKGLGSPKLAGWKPIITPVTREHYLELNRSKVKVTMSINAVADNTPYASRGNYNFLKINLFRCIDQRDIGRQNF